MGITNHFAEANALLASELKFQLDPEAGNTEFRQLLALCGWARFEHCVTLTAMWAKPTAKGVHKYARLMDLLRMVRPEKVDGTKYRNPASAHGKEIHAQMDENLRSAIAGDRY